MYVTVAEKIYSQGFIDWVEEEASKIELKTAGVFSDEPDKEKDLDSSKRISDVGFITNPALRDELFSLVNQVNTYNYGFDVANVADVQYTVYHGSNKGHYDWHSDDEISIGTARHNVRKLSITVQLSHPWEYEGGDFEMYGMDMPTNYKSRGTVLIFPSPQLHRVTPVTKGTRKSLVAWFYGPAWR